MWDRGEGDTVASQSLLAISYIKAHGTQYSEESTWKYDRNNDTHLYYSSTSHGSAASDKQWARTAPALHTHRTAHACGVKRALRLINRDFLKRG